MAGRKSDFTLTKLDDLFTTQAQRDEEQLSKIRDIPLELIDDFPDHPFKVRDDEDILLGFGIVQVGLSLKSHDPSQRANGFLTLAGGIIITFAKEILTLITG